MYDLIVVGGGAAGFFGAIHVAEQRPDLKVAILEQGNKVLSKVRISGGGRCNVTHAEFNPSELVKAYPRGEKELRGPFHVFQPRDTVAFFEARGVPLKVEEDGRMFPESDSSQSIIDCFMDSVNTLGIHLIKNALVVEIIPVESPIHGKIWEVKTKSGTFHCNHLLLATGSSQKMWNILKVLGHRIIDPVPSLFTFHITDPRIGGIQGVSTHARVELVSRELPGKKLSGAIRTSSKRSAGLTSEGPLLITHWGMSGPAILKLSAWGARILYDYNYRFRIRVNWTPDYHQEGMYAFLFEVKDVEARRTVFRTCPLEIPKRLWRKLVLAAGITPDQKWAEIQKKQLQQLAGQLTSSEFLVVGKSPFKEEFVTAGGLDLREINFKTFESKLYDGLYFAGEVLNIDAITGGYNFQNAWTGAYLAARAITDSEN